VLLSYGSGLGPLRNLFAFATGVILVVLLQPVRLQVQRFLDQWLHHGRPPPRSLLTDSTHDMVSATDSRELLGRLSEVLHEGLEFETVATYLRADTASFVRVTGAGDDLPERLPVEVLDDEFPSAREEALRGAGYAVRMKLERAATVHGLLYLGLRRGLYPLGTEGREVVRAFAAQAALALESARRLDELRRQAEEYRILHANTQRIIESSAAAILVCDAAGRILSANSKAAAIFDLETQALVGETLDGLLEVPSSWKPQLPMHAVNAEADTLARPTRRVIMAVSVLELDSGSFNGRVVVLQDVTEFRDLQDRLREQERLASLGRLASGLAHEINTPLTGIASFAQMLGEMTSDTDPRAQLVSKLVDQSFRVSRIVANLREAVRGGREAHTVFDLAQVAERAAHDAARSLGAGDRLSVTRAAGPVMVSAAQGPVELAVSNLVRNAIEASPPEGRVAVEVAGSGEWAEVRVLDRGSGLPEELGDKVFEPFVTTKTERGGTGLGLAITRDMITQLGGEVTLASVPEGGTRATIKLRRWEAPAQSS
jgi:PAS domain S-box-containing protein